MSDKIRNIFKNTECGIVCTLSGVGMVALFIVSFIYTTDMRTDNAYKENPVIVNDSILLNFLILIFVSALIFLFLRYSKRIPIKCVIPGVLMWTAAAGIIWISCAGSSPTHDSYIVSEAAFQAFRGEYEEYVASDYFVHFPFQLGYVLFTELFAFVKTDGVFFAVIQVINVASLVIAYFSILETAKQIFSERAFKLTALLLLIIPQPLLFCTFTYGNIPGFAFAMLSVMFLVKFNRTEKILYGVFTSLCIGLAVMIKMNNMIVFAAELIYIVFSCFSNARELIKKSVCIVLCILSVTALKMIPVAVYEKRADLDFGDGIPMLSWLAMGLNESQIACGWYSGVYTVLNFEYCGRDTQKASESSAENIKDRLQTFSDDTVYATEFFTAKFITQFNETTYQSIWTNQVRQNTPGYPVSIARFICTDGERSTKIYMDAVAQFVFACAVFACIFTFLKKNDGACLFLLIVLGGMMYHMLFEAKSQYFLTYYVMLVPVSAFGFDSLINVLEARTPKFAYALKNVKDRKNA